MKTKHTQMLKGFSSSLAHEAFHPSRSIIRRAVPLVCAVVLFHPALLAQRCLGLSISGLMGQYLPIPGDAAANFKQCKTTVNEHGQLVIVNHGQDLIDLDTMLQVQGRAFGEATIAGTAPSMPSGAAVEDAQALAKKLQGMSPEQQRAWAMQQAGQQRQNTRATVQDDPGISMLVQKTYAIASIQLPTLNQELSAKLREAEKTEQADLDKVPGPDLTTCPPIDKYGTLSCTCTNAVEGKYWKQMVAIHDRYDAEAIALLTTYLPQIKTLVSQVEANISTLKNGDAVQDPKMKSMLLGAQSAAFGNAFSITGATIESIRTDGPDVYVNKVNCDKRTYALNCK